MLPSGNIGLALSGGGTRCLVHVGMMQALDEVGVSFDLVSGASAGSIIGALYCNGYTPVEILQLLTEINYFKIFRPALNWKGLLNIERAAGVLSEYLPQDFQSLKKPLFVSATNLTKGKPKYFKKGQLIRPLLASCSIPVIFNPVKINHATYVDGGIMDNLPIDPLKKKVDVIIGMHCNPIGKKQVKKNWKELLEYSLLMAISSRDVQKKKKCHLFWEPPEMVNYTVFDLKRMKEIYEIGYAYGKQEVAKLQSVDMRIAQ